MEPPFGFGKKCPKKLAYKRFVRLNIPLDNDKAINFTTVLFGLIRESLKIKVLNFDEIGNEKLYELELEKYNDELRSIIKKIWPFVPIEKLNIALPFRDGIIKKN